MSSATMMILFVLLLGILGKSNVIAAAAAIMLILQFLRLQELFPVLEERGLELGWCFWSWPSWCPLRPDVYLPVKYSDPFLRFRG